MKVQIVATTDGKHVGEVYEVPLINYEVMSMFRMAADRINWFGNVCVVQNVNYTIKLKKIGE